MLARALEMSMEPGDSKPTTKTAASSEPNLAAMTEEELPDGVQNDNLT